MRYRYLWGDDAMRPSSIIWFERIIFATLVLGVLQSFLSWDQATALVANIERSPTAVVLIVQGFSFLIVATLTLLVSRRRSKVAMWISIALLILGMPAFVALLAQGLVLGSGLISLLQVLGQFVAYGLLFTPASRRWMRGEEPPVEVFL